MNQKTSIFRQISAVFIQHKTPIFRRFFNTLFFRHLKQQKIQGTYFKISALCFKIYGS